MKITLLHTLDREFGATPYARQETQTKNGRLPIGTNYTSRSAFREQMLKCRSQRPPIWQGLFFPAWENFAPITAIQIVTNLQQAMNQLATSIDLLLLFLNIRPQTNHQKTINVANGAGRGLQMVRSPAKNHI